MSTRGLRRSFFIRVTSIDMDQWVTGTVSDLKTKSRATGAVRQFSFFWESEFKWPQINSFCFILLCFLLRV